MTLSRASSETSLAQLLALIDAELTLIREGLASALMDKQRALVESELVDLQQLSEREASAAGQLAALEAERVIAAAELARELGVTARSPEEVSLGMLLEAMPAGEERALLASRAIELEQAMFNVLWLNDDNRHLTQNLLDYTGLVMRLLTQGDARPSYSADGRVAESGPGRALLDDSF